MLTLLTEVAVQNTSSPSSIAKLSNIMDGVDGSGAFNLSQETEAIQVEDNQRRQISESITLDLRVIEDSGQSAIIDAIQAAQDKALITAYTPNGFVVFPDPVLLMRNKQFDGVLASAVFATLKGTPGFRGNPRSRYFHAGRNLLGVYDVTTTDDSLQGLEVINGFDNSFTPGQIASSISVPDPVTGGQGMDLEATDGFYSYTFPFLFPFGGRQLTFSFTTGSGIGTPTARVRFYDSLGNTVGNTDAAGQTQVTATAPANAVTVRFGINTGTDTIEIFRPMVTIDGSTNFEL